MSATGASKDVAVEGLRERNKPLEAGNTEDAKKIVLELNAQEDAEQAEGKDEIDQKTYGRTPGGIGTNVHAQFSRLHVAFCDSLMLMES